MRFIFFITLFLLFFVQKTTAQPKMQLSSQAKFSILIGSAGEPLYAAFGHAAIRLHDPVLAIDIVYNYGVFDFDTPDFYTKFVRGRLPYQLAIGQIGWLSQAYREERRALYEQDLNLTPEEVQALFDFLGENLKPQNRYYAYDFFYDNCATRIRDALQKVLGKKLQLDYSNFPPKKTFRQLINPSIEKKVWIDLGIDLILGLRADQIATPEQYMFLPEYVMEGLKKATIERDGRKIPLVKKTKTLVEPDPRKVTALPLPAIIFWIAFVAVAWLTYKQWKQGSQSLWFDKSMFIKIGLIGMFFLLLWVATEHKALAQNLNMVWALPTHAFIGIVLFFKIRNNLWVAYYFLATALLNALLLLNWWWFPQALHYALYPVVLIVALRATYLFLLFRKNVSLK